MKTERLSVIVLLVAVAILFTSGVSYAARDELRVGIDLVMTRVDPATIGTTTDRFIVVNTYNGLLKFKAGTSEIEKDLAESYQVSRDGKVITFKLRKGVQFHKGYGELTSSDVKFTIMRHLDPKTKSRDFKNFSVVDHVEALDKYTVKIFLKRPSAGFLGILAFHGGLILSEKAVNDLGKKISTTPIGTGPFRFESRIPGSEIVLTANEDYFLGPPNIKKIIFKVIPEASVSVNAAQKGDIDFYMIEDIGAWRMVEKLRDRNFKVSNYPTTGVYYYYLNCQSGPTRHLKVRQAIAHAIDAKAMARSFGALVSYTPSVFPSVLSGYTDQLPTYEYDVERAKKLLKEAGYDKDTKIEVSYVKFGLHEAYAIMAKDYLSKIMDAELLQMDLQTFHNILKEGRFQVYAQALGRATEDIFASGYFHSKGPGSFPGYENAELDRLIEQADMEQDPSKRKAMYKKMQEIMAVNLPYLAGGVKNVPVIMNKNLEGVIPEAHPGVTKFYKAYFKD